MPLQEQKNAQVASSLEKRESRKKKIDELMTTIGGYELSIRMLQDEREFGLVDELRPLLKLNYERLKKVMYGLPEERT